MLPLRFSVFLIILFFYMIVLLSNGNAVAIDIFSLRFQIQLSIIIFCSTVFGGFFVLFIRQIYKSMKKTNKSNGIT